MAPPCWTVDEVAALLAAEEADPDVVRIIKEEAVDGSKLLLLTDDMLVMMGVGKKAMRAKILLLAQQFSSTTTTTVDQIRCSAGLNLIQGAMRHDPVKYQGGVGLCERHILPFQFLCEECDMLSCPSCVVEQHEGHRLTPPSECTDSIRAELEGFVSKLGEQSSHIEKILSTCGSTLGMLEHHVKTSIEEINSTREKIIEALNTASELAIAQVKEHEASKKCYLLRKVEENISLKTNIDSLRADLMQFLRESSPSLVIQQREAMKRSCTTLLGETKAQSIAQLDAMFSIGVSIDEDDEGALHEILNLLKNSLILITVNKTQPQLLAEIPSLWKKTALIVQPATRIIALGGESGPAFLSSAELYDESTHSWMRLPNMLCLRGRYPAIGHADNKIYVAGGLNENETLSSAEVLDLTTLAWTALPPMTTTRRSTSGVFLADRRRFLVIGGHDGLNRLSTCEIFDTASNSWTPAASLTEPRSVHCTVLYKLKPVVLGGWNSNHLMTCEEYDHVFDKWTPFPSFINARNFFGATVIEEKIYIAGGSMEDDLLDSIEVFDGAIWASVFPTLLVPRGACAAVCLNNKLVVLGGEDETVDVYDPATDLVSSDVLPKMAVDPLRCKFAAMSF